MYFQAIRDRVDITSLLTEVLQQSLRCLDLVKVWLYSSFQDLHTQVIFGTLVCARKIVTLFNLCVSTVAKSLYHPAVYETLKYNPRKLDPHVHQ
jgi:hypothetical protein